MGLSLSRNLESTKHQSDLCLIFEFCLKVASMFLKYSFQCLSSSTLPPETYAVVFLWRGLIWLCSYSFWRRLDFFKKAVERLQFLTRAELLLFIYTGGIIIICLYSFARVVCHVHALSQGRELSTIAEGQGLGTVHIVEGTCSRMCSS